MFVLYLWIYSKFSDIIFINKVMVLKNIEYILKKHKIFQARGSVMIIYKVLKDKKQYIDLLLLADEQEDMIDRYLERGTMYVLDDNGIKAECVVTIENDDILEIKNIAVLPECQGIGYGRALIEWIIREYKGRYSILQVGTGDSPSTVPFYEKCGFVKSHMIKNFFIDNYDHPIIENGTQIKDMVYLQKRI